MFTLYDVNISPNVKTSSPTDIKHPHLQIYDVNISPVYIIYDVGEDVFTLGLMFTICMDVMFTKSVGEDVFTLGHPHLQIYDVGH